MRDPDCPGCALLTLPERMEREETVERRELLAATDLMAWDLPPYTTSANGYIYGTWFCGRPTAKYYGAFPKSFWPRAKTLLMLPGGSMLHWFSGTVGREPGIVTVDGNPAANPDTLCVGSQLPFPDGHFDSAFADPPYSIADARRYGFKYPPARAVLREMARVTKPGGRIGLLHEFLPAVKGSGAKLIGAVGILNGPQKRIRGLYLFRRLPGSVMNWTAARTKTGGKYSAYSAEKTLAHLRAARVSAPEARANSTDATGATMTTAQRSTSDEGTTETSFGAAP